MALAAIVYLHLDPNLEREELFAGRIYTIFGYSSDIDEVWSRLKFKPYVGRKMFVTTEGFDWESQVRIKRLGLPGQ